MPRLSRHHHRPLRGAPFAGHENRLRGTRKFTKEIYQPAHCSTTALGNAPKLTSSPSLQPVRRR
jgi:hypothetical protein